MNEVKDSLTMEYQNKSQTSLQNHSELEKT